MAPNATVISLGIVIGMDVNMNKLYLTFLSLVIGIFYGCNEQNAQSKALEWSSDKILLNQRLRLNFDIVKCRWTSWSQEIGSSSWIPAPPEVYICGLALLSNENVQALRNEYKWNPYYGRMQLFPPDCSEVPNDQWLYSENYLQSLTSKTSYCVGLILLHRDNNIIYFYLNTL